jgi:hypothetical protein
LLSTWYEVERTLSSKTYQTDDSRSIQIEITESLRSEEGVHSGVHKAVHAATQPRQSNTKRTVGQTDKMQATKPTGYARQC